MKKVIILIVSILLSTGFQSAYANKDFPQIKSADYNPSTCTLKLVFGGNDSKTAPAINIHHSDIRYYTVYYPGTVTVYNTNRNYAYADILASDGVRVPGCIQACSLGPISGTQTIWPAGAIHNTYSWQWWGSDGTLVSQDPYYADAYTFTQRYWPHYTQVRSGVDEWIGSAGDYQEIDGGLVGFGTTAVTFIPDGNGMGNCAKCSTAISSTKLYESTVSPACDNGAVINSTSSTDSANKTTYNWSCSSSGGANMPCTAQSKPIIPPTATNPQCDEYRLPRQCSYGVRTVDKSQETSTGPLSIPLVNQLPISTSPYAPGACRPPVDGKPRVVCDADPFTTISSTLTSFTLPSSVTQKQGNCKVVFDSVDTCKPNGVRTDTIAFKGVPEVPDCTKDPTNPACDPVVYTSSGKVCIRLTDKFKNILTHIPATQVTITGSLTTDSYIKTDTSRYSLGEVEIVADTYCVAPPPPPECIPGVDPACTSICIPGDPGCPSSTDPYCPPGATNCPGPVVLPILNVGVGNPGGRTSYINDMATHPSGGVIIIKKKSCTGHIEVLDGEVWNTDGVMYDTEQLYRIVVDGSNPACTGGTIALSGGGITATGGTLDSVSPLTLSGGYMTFLAKILRPIDTTTTERHPRGVYASLMYTEPSGGIRYGLTASDSDFTDSPLLITGDRMKGVRVLGNTLGSNMSMFNHNNGNAIAEQTALITESRNAMIKNINLLTRGMEDYNSSNKIINGILYKEGNVAYSSIESLNFQTLVVKGGDLTIDRDIDTAKGIIVIRGDKVSSGNIIIADGVKFIYASIFAEGTFRGASIAADNKNPDIQLVLKGSLFSRNTIGGSADPAALYTSGNAKTDNLNEAFIQDLNHVRSGNGGSKHKGYVDPFIIEYDNMQGTPLPGFSN